MHTHTHTCTCTDTDADRHRHRRRRRHRRRHRHTRARAFTPLKSQILNHRLRQMIGSMTLAPLPSSLLPPPSSSRSSSLLPPPLLLSLLFPPPFLAANVPHPCSRPWPRTYRTWQMQHRRWRRSGGEKFNRRSQGAHPTRTPGKHNI